VEFPTVFTHARTAEACVRKTRKAMMVGVAVMLEAGQAPPLAASEEQRNHQINIRLTAEEKLFIESAARRRGFRGISDFVRSAALAQTRRAG
jgi:predicted RNase H-like HicB family nuclease